MSTSIWLTDEDADLAGYKRATLRQRSDVASLVRAVTDTVDGPTAGVQATRGSGGAALAWITDGLEPTEIAAEEWTVRVWAYQSDGAANAALRVQVRKYDYGEDPTPVVDDNPGTELGTTLQGTNRTSTAVATSLDDGDRLVIVVLFDDASAQTQVAGHTATLSYNGLIPRVEGDSHVVCPTELSLSAETPRRTMDDVRGLVHDIDGEIRLCTDGEVQQCIRDALAVYTRTNPRETYALLDGDGSTVDYPLPRDWIWGLSAIRSVEYPVGETPTRYLDTGWYGVMETTLGAQPVRFLRFESAPEAGTGNVLVRYQTRHRHDDEYDTVPSSDYEAFTWLAGAHLAEMKAAQAAGGSDPTILADTTNHRDAEQRWRSVANTLRERYDAYMGIGEEAGNDVRPATVFSDWDTSASWGARWLSHGRRGR